MFGWSEYKGDPIKGIKVEGDKTVPPTKWWNVPYLRAYVWKVVTVFEVSQEAARDGYRIGYVPFKGKAMLEDVGYHDRRCFGMLNGYEDCTFFAVSVLDGSEVPLAVFRRTDKEGVAMLGVALH